MSLSRAQDLIKTGASCLSFDVKLNSCPDVKRLCVGGVCVHMQVLGRQRKGLLGLVIFATGNTSEEK